MTGDCPKTIYGKSSSFSSTGRTVASNRRIGCFVSDTDGTAPLSERTAISRGSTSRDGSAGLPCQPNSGGADSGLVASWYYLLTAAERRSIQPYKRTIEPTKPITPSHGASAKSA